LEAFPASAREEPPEREGRMDLSADLRLVELLAAGRTVQRGQVASRAMRVEGGSVAGRGLESEVGSGECRVASLKKKQTPPDQTRDSSSDRPVVAGRIRRSWEARECAARGPVPTRSGSPIVGLGKRKKQVPPDRTRDSRHSSGARRCSPRQDRCRRNDNSRAFGRALRRVVGLAAERVRGRAGSGGSSCL
jgi:hypothetical protein